MTSAEMCAWWLMTFGAGEVPLKEAFLQMRRAKLDAAGYIHLRNVGFLTYVSFTDRPDCFQITEAGIEAINAGD